MSFIGYVLSVLFILVKLQEMQIYSKEAPFKKALNELFKILVFLVKRSCLFFGGSCFISTIFCLRIKEIHC